MKIFSNYVCFSKSPNFTKYIAKLASLWSVSPELNKQKDNYSFKYTICFVFLRIFNFDILKIRWFNALAKKEDFEHTFSTNQPCHL